MRSIFDDIGEAEAGVQREPRDPHLRYQLGNLYLEFRFSRNPTLIGENMPKARDEFVYCLSIDRNHIRAWCGLAFSEQELWKERGRLHINSQYKQEGHLGSGQFDESGFLQRMKTWLGKYGNTEKLASTISRIAAGRELAAEECADIADVVRPYNEADFLSYMARAKSLDPDNKKVLEYDADMFMKDMLFTQAAEKYRHAIGLNPEDYELRYWFIASLHMAGMGQEAAKQSIERRRLKAERFGRPENKKRLIQLPMGLDRL